MNNHGIYAYQGSSGDWYLDCPSNTRARLSYTVCKQIDRVWLSKRDAWAALDRALDTIRAEEEIEAEFDRGAREQRAWYDTSAELR